MAMQRAAGRPATCEHRGMGYVAALAIAILVIVGCVSVFRQRRRGL
jgi:hypothetical protein